MLTDKTLEPELLADSGEMDLGELTHQERTRAKKELMKKIEQYNKDARTKRPSFPMTNPTKVRRMFKSGLRPCQPNDSLLFCNSY